MTFDEMKRFEDRIIAAEHKTTAIGDRGVNFTAVVSDPFGQSRTGFKTLSTAYPDGDTSPFVSLTTSAVISFSGATATSCLISPIIPNADNAGGLTIVYGTPADVLGNTPTATSIVAVQEATVAHAIDVHLNSRFRIIVTGLHIIATSSADNTSGSIKAYDCGAPAYSAVGVWRTYGAVASSRFEETRQLYAGGTARSLTGGRLGEWNDLPATQYAVFPDGIMIPGFIVSGMSATTTFEVTAVFHYEVLSSPTTLPFASPDRGLEPEMEQVYYFLNCKERFVSGNSFKSFFQSIGRGLRSAFRFIERIAPIAAPLIAAL